MEQVRQDTQGSQATQVSRMCKKVHGSKVHRFGLVPLTAYLKLAALYNLCAAHSLLTTHYSLPFLTFGPPLLQGGYAFPDSPTDRFDKVLRFLECASVHNSLLAVGRTFEPMNLSINLTANCILPTANYTCDAIRIVHRSFTTHYSFFRPLATSY